MVTSVQVNYERKFPNIQTKRLLLRKLGHNDIETIYEIYADEYTAAQHGMRALSEVDEAKQILFGMKSLFNSDEGICWGVEVRKNHKCVGIVSLKFENKRNDTLLLGYDLHPLHRGRGYMKETLTAVIKNIRSKGDTKKIKAFVNKSNAKSKKLLKGLGFYRISQSILFLMVVNLLR